MASLNSSTSDNSTPLLLPAVTCHTELMEIYIWPFVFVCLYIVLGTLGNAVTIYIYTFRWPKTKTRIYILSLGLINFLNSVFNMPIEAYILWHPLQFDQHVLCKITRGLTFVLNNSCACVFVSIAIDRLLLVYRPLRRTVLTEAYARNGCILSVVIGFCTGWPGFVFYGTATLPEKLNGVIAIGKTCYIADEYLKHLTWPSNFNKALFSLMLFIFVLLLVLYIAVGRKIYQVTKSDNVVKTPKTRLARGILVLKAVHRLSTNRNSSQTADVADSNNTTENNAINTPTLQRLRSVAFSDLSEPERKSEEKSTHSCNSSQPEVTYKLSRRFSSANAGAWRDNTISMTMITVAYVACYLPYLIIVSLRYVDSDLYTELNISSKIAYHVFLRTYFLNSAINPFIYSFVNSEFRRTFTDLVISLFKKSRNRSSSIV